MVSDKGKMQKNNNSLSNFQLVLQLHGAQPAVQRVVRRQPAAAGAARVHRRQDGARARRHRAPVQRPLLRHQLGAWRAVTAGYNTYNTLKLIVIKLIINYIKSLHKLCQAYM